MQALSLSSKQTARFMGKHRKTDRNKGEYTDTEKTVCTDDIQWTNK